ncbi:MAG: hypothetical protein AAF125_20575, partial [Chloroflexota bacterium]
TVMAADPPKALPQTPIVDELHRRWDAGPTPMAARRAEDEEAAALLGATIEHLEMPDCIYRTAEDGTPLYPTEESLWSDVHPEDVAVQYVRAYQAPRVVTQIYAPLGVGEHVDHLIIRDLGLRLAEKATIPVFLYPEFPYTAAPDAIERALAALPPTTKTERISFHLTAADIAAKIDSVRAYRSQISTFWESATALEDRVRAALRQGEDTAPTETIYQLR